eukprot:3587342-Amphidinium_carterae.1
MNFEPYDNISSGIQQVHINSMCLACNAIMAYKTVRHHDQFYKSARLHRRTCYYNHNTGADSMHLVEINSQLV